MNTRYYWEKNFFSDNYRIYLNNELIGKLEDHTFSQSIAGMINEKKYIFRKLGILKQHTVIVDSLTNIEIGKITFDNMMTNALISLNNQPFVWKYENIWCTRWSVLNSDGLKINYFSSAAKGKIEIDIDNDLLILSGLYVKNYYWQMTIVIILLAIIPILFL